MKKILIPYKENNFIKYITRINKVSKFAVDRLKGNLVRKSKMSYKCRNTPLPVLRLYKITVAHYKITKTPTKQATSVTTNKKPRNNTDRNVNYSVCAHNLPQQPKSDNNCKNSNGKEQATL